MTLGSIHNSCDVCNKILFTSHCCPRRRFHNDHLLGKWNKAGSDRKGDRSCSRLQGHVQRQCQPHTLRSVEKSGMKYQVQKKSLSRSSGFWSARLCSGDLGTKAATWEPGRELGAADPALGGHVLRGHHRQQPCLSHDAPGIKVEKVSITSTTRRGSG